LSFWPSVKYNRHFQPKAENAGEQKGRLPVKAQVHEAQSSSKDQALVFQVA